MKLIKENEKGTNYQTDKFKILYRNKWSIAGDNLNNPREEIYFITGKAEITLDDSVEIIDAPCKIVFPEKTYHKIEALTDISFVLFD